MSMCHKAYSLDHGLFDAELAPVLYEALQTGHERDLRLFIQSNLPRLTFPWEGQPLPTDWSSVLQLGDIHELGDLALTKFYDAEGDSGLQEHWMRVDEDLPEAIRPCLLGEPFGPPGKFFDPGRMGSYFQTPNQAVYSREALASYPQPELRCFVTLLEGVVKNGKGLYVTF